MNVTRLKIPRERASLTSTRGRRAVDSNLSSGTYARLLERMPEASRSTARASGNCGMPALLRHLGQTRGERETFNQGTNSRMAQPV